MAEIQFIVDKLNEPPFSKDLRLVRTLFSGMRVFVLGYIRGIAQTSDKPLSWAFSSVSKAAMMHQDRSTQQYPPRRSWVDGRGAVSYVMWDTRPYLWALL